MPDLFGKKDETAPVTDDVTATEDEDTSTHEERNPITVPEGWEAVPVEQGGGIRPTTVPWKGYTN